MFTADVRVQVPPRPPIFFSHVITYGRVVELVDSLDLGSNARACRFESCRPHQIKRQSTWVDCRFFLWISCRHPPSLRAPTGRGNLLTARESHTFSPVRKYAKNRREPPKAERHQSPIASQPPLLLLFTLSSLPCVSKAASSALKTNQQFLAVRCYAVFS